LTFNESIQWNQPFIFGPIWTQFRSKQLNWIYSIELTSWPNFKLFRLKLSPNWTNNVKNWIILVRFGLNVGLNNLKFGQEAIFLLNWLNQINSIGSTWLDRMANFCLFWLNQKWQKLEGFGIFRGQNIQIILKNFCNIFDVLEDWKFPIFRTLWKNDVKIELQKLQKTCSDSYSYSNIRVQVQNAGP